MMVFMIKYLGSKRLLVPWIIDAVRHYCHHAHSVLDLFSGTSRVGYAFKSLGFRVESNDHNRFAYHLAHCYIETDLADIPKDFFLLIDHLNNLPGKYGFFTENYCVKSRFFHPKNGEKIDHIRLEIDKLDIDHKLRSVLLVSLMEAADRVDSTCGIQMAYLKAYAPRAFIPLTLRMPKLLAKSSYGVSKAHCLEAHKAAQEVNCDITYLDPPYNQHNYRGNYHIWETLVCNDKPDVYGTAHKRIDCKSNKSIFNSKISCQKALAEIIAALSSRYIIISFNDEGFISKENMEDMLYHFGDLTILEKEYKRYVGAKIGIYNNKGVKVGNINKLDNKEFLYIIDRR